MLRDVVATEQLRLGLCNGVCKGYSYGYGQFGRLWHELSVRKGIVMSDRSEEHFAADEEILATSLYVLTTHEDERSVWPAHTDISVWPAHTDISVWPAHTDTGGRISPGPCNRQPAHGCTRMRQSTQGPLATPP